MSVERPPQITPRMQAALTELESMIREHYPKAEFRVNPSQEDPEIIHLTTTVDVEDTEEVLDLVIDRMMEMQIEDDLPIFVIPVRPRERVLAEMKKRQEHPLPWLSRLEEGPRARTTRATRL